MATCKEQSMDAFEQIAINLDRALYYGEGNMSQKWVSDLAEHSPKLPTMVQALVENEAENVKLAFMVRILEQLEKATYLQIQLCWDISTLYHNQANDIDAGHGMSLQ